MAKFLTYFHSVSVGEQEFTADANSTIEIPDELIPNVQPFIDSDQLRLIKDEPAEEKVEEKPKGRKARE